jgi:electron transport complex protein RnfE
MSAQDAKLIKQGLWDNNPALVQLLGLCPLLAVTNSVVNALGLGVATLIVLTGSNLTISLFRNLVPEAVRLPIFVMIIAALVTAIELLMQALTYDLYLILGIFIPLIVTNCIIMGRADAFASRNPVRESLIDGLSMSVGFLIVLVLLGAIRELVGTGALFANMHLLFGEAARDWHWIVAADYPQFLFAILPPGAFVALGLLIAVKNLIDARIEAKRKALECALPPHKGVKGNKRVRVTGHIT